MHSLLTMKDKRWTDFNRAAKYDYNYRKGWTHSLNEKMRDYKDVDLSMSA